MEYMVFEGGSIKVFERFGSTELALRALEKENGLAIYFKGRSGMWYMLCRLLGAKQDFPYMPCYYENVPDVVKLAVMIQ